MIKFPNLLKAAGIMLTLVWGLYGNVQIGARQTEDVKFADPVEDAQIVAEMMKPPVPPKGILKHPTVTIDLTKVPSKSRTLSAPLKSDVGLP